MSTPDEPSAVRSYQNNSGASIGTQNNSYPAPAPALPWNIPAGPDKLFGRDDAVVEVAALIESHRVTVMTGSGGLGKTALAAAAIARVAGKSDAPRRFTGGILLHDFYSAPSHAAAIQSILIQTREDTDERGAETRARAQLSVPHRLIYLEGCEKADDLSALLAITGTTTVVITTRNDHHRQHGHEYIVPPLSDEHAAALIHHHWARGTVAACGPLARMIGGHALACERAGILLRLDSVQPAALLAKLQKRGLPAIHPHKDGAAGRDHEHSAVGHLLQMDAAAVREKNEHALRVWSLLAFHALSPLPIDPLPEREKIAENPAEQPAVRPGIITEVLQISEAEADAALEALRTRSLVKVESLCVSHDGSEERHARLAHALLSEHARPYDSQFPYVFPLGEKEALDIASRAIDWWKDTIHRWGVPGAMPGLITRYTLLTPQFDQLPARAEAALARSTGVPPVASGGTPDGSTAGIPTCRDAHSQPAPGFPAGKQGAETAPLLVLTDPILIFLIAELGYLENAFGHYTKAEPLYVRALEARERTLGREHPATLSSVNNLAALYYNQGDYAKAEPLFVRALEACERTLGREHQDTLRSVNNLAELYRSQGDYAKAEPLFVRALEARERTLGREHPDTLSSVNNLAGLYYNQGDYAKAEPLYERALEALERTLGVEHAHTLICVNNLAVLYKNQGDYAKAEPLYVRALEVRERTLGREHPQTLTSVNNLAGFLHERGRSAQALPLILWAVEGRERVLGPQHPDTINSRTWLDAIRKAVEEGSSPT